MRKIILTCSLLLSTIAFTQVGINTATPNLKSILDITSSNKGVLFPRLTVSQRNNISGLSINQLGLTIFNTDTKCYNVWNGGSWDDLCGPESNDGKSDFTINCNTATVSSNLEVGESVNSVITLEINATAIGSWSIQTNTISGVHYSGAGKITAPGIQLIQLQAIGIPTTANDNAVFTITDTKKPPTGCNVSVKILDQSKVTYTILSLKPENWNSSLGPSNNSFTSKLRAALTSNFSPSGKVKISGFKFIEADASESIASFTQKLNSANIVWCGWPDTNSWTHSVDKIQAFKSWILNKKGVAIIHGDDNDHAIFPNVLGYATPFFGNQAGSFTNKNVIPLNGKFGDIRSVTFPVAGSGANQSAVLGDGDILGYGSGTNSNVALIILKDNYIILGNIDWAGNTAFGKPIFEKLYMNIFEWAVKNAPIK